MQNPKVSIIIPIYNVEQYIERCARSLFEQSLESLEFIFINDCTPDKSIEVLEKVADEYPHRSHQIRIINMPHNSGQAAVRIKGIYSATGEYLIHCDSDDWVDVDMYNILYNTAIAQKADIVDCDYFITDGTTKQIIKDNFPSEKDLIIRNILNQKSANSLCNKLIKRSIFQDNKFRLPNESNGEDFVLTIQSIFYSKQTFYLNQPLYYYYRNPNSITNQRSDKKIIENFNQVYNNINIILDFLNVHYERYFNNDIIHLKLIKRNLLLNLSTKLEHLKLWRNTYPEINSKVLFCKTVNFKEKVDFILTYLGVSYFVKRGKMIIKSIIN